MELAFSTKRLRKLCEDPQSADEALGASVASRLRAKLADIDVADDISQVLAAPKKPVETTPDGRVTIELADGIRLLLSANHNPQRVHADRTIDWARVTRLKVLEIG